MAGALETNFDTMVRPRLTEIMHWIRMGSPEREVCQRVGIGYTAWNNYKTSYPEFKQMLSDSRKQTSNRVESALYKRATGYDFVELRTVESEDGVVTTTTTKHMPPDVVACIFILKNTEKGFWKDKTETDMTVKTPQTMAEVVRGRRERLLLAENTNG